MYLDVWERREKRGGRKEIGERRRQYNAKPMGSAFRPHDSEGLGDVQNKDWAKGEVKRGGIKSSRIESPG